MAWAWMSAGGTGSPVLIDGAAADLFLDCLE